MQRGQCTISTCGSFLNASFSSLLVVMACGGITQSARNHSGPQPGLCTSYEAVYLHPHQRAPAKVYSAHFHLQTRSMVTMDTWLPFPGYSRCTRVADCRNDAPSAVFSGFCDGWFPVCMLCKCAVSLSIQILGLPATGCYRQRVYTSPYCQLVDPLAGVFAS
jgi:hypothetical protein